MNVGGLRERQSGRVKKEREKRREREERKVMRAGPPFCSPHNQTLAGGQASPMGQGLDPKGWQVPLLLTL